MSQVPVVPGAVIRCRPVGALMMEDEAGGDEKILAVPVDALHPFYAGVQSYRDLPTIMCEQIAHFFQHYKDLEKGKWVSIARWLDADGAEKLVDGRDRAGEEESRRASRASPSPSRSPCRNPSGRRYLPLSTPITLPMSFTPAAPVSLMAASIAAATSASDICFGR